MPTVSYVIQVNHETVGIAVRHDADYRFYASSPGYLSLEGLSFRRLRDIEQAASRIGAEHSVN